MMFNNNNITTHYHWFGINYSAQEPDYFWQLSPISTHKPFLTQYLTMGVYYLHSTCPSWYCSISRTIGTSITTEMPFLSTWRHSLNLTKLYIKHYAQPSTVTILSWELDTHMMVRESNSPNINLCDRVLLCIIGKKSKLIGNFHHFTLITDTLTYVYA
jgi:hypothetical protein